MNIKLNIKIACIMGTLGATIPIANAGLFDSVTDMTKNVIGGAQEQAKTGEVVTEKDLLAGVWKELFKAREIHLRGQELLRDVDKAYIIAATLSKTMLEQQEESRKTAENFVSNVRSILDDKKILKPIPTPESLKAKTKVLTDATKEVIEDRMIDLKKFKECSSGNLKSSEKTEDNVKCEMWNSKNIEAEITVATSGDKNADVEGINPVTKEALDRLDKMMKEIGSTFSSNKIHYENISSQVVDTVKAFSTIEGQLMAGRKAFPKIQKMLDRAQKKLEKEETALLKDIVKSSGVMLLKGKDIKKMLADISSNPFENRQKILKLKSITEEIVYLTKSFANYNSIIDNANKRLASLDIELSNVKKKTKAISNNIKTTKLTYKEVKG